MNMGSNLRLRDFGWNFCAPQLAERKAKLRSLLPKSDHLFYCDHVGQNGEALFELSCQKDLEGIVAKLKYDPYLPGTRWLKIRKGSFPFNRQALVLGLCQVEALCTST